MSRARFVASIIRSAKAAPKPPFARSVRKARAGAGDHAAAQPKNSKVAAA